MAVKLANGTWVGGVGAEHAGAINTANYQRQLVAQNNPNKIGGVGAEHILQAAIDAEIRALVNAAGPNGVSAYDGGQHAAALADTAYNTAVSGGKAEPNANGSVTGYSQLYGTPTTPNPTPPGYQVPETGPVSTVFGSKGVISRAATPSPAASFGNLLAAPAATPTAPGQSAGSGSLPGGGAALLFGTPNAGNSRVVK